MRSKSIVQFRTECHIFKIERPLFVRSVRIYPIYYLLVFIPSPAFFFAFLVNRPPKIIESHTILFVKTIYDMFFEVLVFIFRLIRFAPNKQNV